MKFMLIMHVNPTIWDGLSDDERDAVTSGHGEFMKTIERTGEMVSTHALGAPSDSAVVRVEGGTRSVTDGPFQRTDAFLGGYYLVDCESRERALEVAALVPDARIKGLGIEVRPVVFSAGAAV